MKRKLFFSTVAAFLLLFLGYGCSDDDYLSDREIRWMIEESLDDQWIPVPLITIESTDWQWYENEVEGFYAVTVELPELTPNIFDDGVALAYYQFNSDTKTALPYVKTTIGSDGIPFTETYSCDFQLGTPSTATFYLEASDVGRYDSYPPAAIFQIVLIY